MGWHDFPACDTTTYNHSDALFFLTPTEEIANRLVSCSNFIRLVEDLDLDPLLLLRLRSRGLIAFIARIRISDLMNLPSRSRETTQASWLLQEV